ncbi:FHF complex subunit HOOK-interacting protein 1A isoform X2 [Triplophysa rosa]|uniref:FHF complex subunit HOOK-interacting protein 1A isoform X2 n=1 Tax=Triplophysa rosa TaxID=992332 RepID=UPI00254637B4|nr:FHF complex subunit HOOK-interacting protein 1A isoform X2 [Triplophysa rosa]
MLVSSCNHGRAFSLRGVDPETCMIVFRNHWTQVLRILDKHDPGRGVSLSGAQRFGPIPGDEASAVQNYVEHMLFMLMEEERGHGGAMGPILEFVVVENVMEKLFLWSLRREFTDDMKLEQLRTYEMLLTRAKQPLLHHKPVLRPLMMLLSACSSSCTAPGKHTCSTGGGGAEVEAELVSLLHQLCRGLAKEASVLELFFHGSEDQGAANFLLFSLLIPFVHRDGTVGAQARDALTLIMNLSSRNHLVAKHIAESTFFCPVLATGLSGLYSGLPAKLEVYSDSWFCLERNDWLQVPELFQFLNSLNFCSTVCQVAHPSIRDQLLDYIYNGFLVPVMAPALHKLTLEEVITTTAYLELFLRSICEPALLQTFLVFILTHRHDNVNILDTLLGTVSLALFRTLIGLYCEDVMLQLILRYLIPCSHLLCGERLRLRERDCYSVSASALLSLTPTFFMTEPRCSPSQPPKPDYILWSKVTEGLLRGNTSTEDLFSCGDSVGCSRVSASEPLMEKNYLEYLCDARRVICASVQACSVWSAPYDGLNPSPDEWREDEEENDDQEGVPSQTPTPQPPSDGERVELEWDDKYDAAPDEHGSPHHGDRPVPDEPPKHIQEMRKSAIMLIEGSYVEESDFQDDVLVYNLIAQKDARDDRRTSIKNTIRHNCANTTRKQTDNSHTNDDAQTHNHPWRRLSPNPRGCSHESEAVELTARPGSQTSAVIVNGRASEERKRLTVEQHQIKPISTSDDSHDFISQCLELIRHHGGEEESVMNDDEHLQRLRTLLRGEEEGVDFCDEHDDEELNTTRSHKRGVPFTGPFISVLLSRLESLLENSIEVNLLLTGILAQLVSYPQPLLRGFLLHTRPLLQPGLTSLYQVLVSVRSQIEQYTTSRPDFTELIREAARSLLLKHQILQERERDVDLQENEAGLCISSGLCKPLPPCPRIPAHMQSKVFAVILFSEFLKELAAIAQEHSILP